MSGFATAFGISLTVYIVAMFGISFWAKGQIHNTEDYLVAGRRLPLSLAWATLFATWFGAGTLLTATEEVREGGLVRAALDPFGAGVCLILAGLFFAKKLWELKLITLADFFRTRFGPKAEFVASVVMVPGYIGWVAAQFVALAGILHLFFDMPMAWGIFLVFAIGLGYTLVGGMWSVTLTDAVQVVLVILGLGALGWSTFSTLGDGSVIGGVIHTLDATPAHKLVIIPKENLHEFVMWLGVFCAGALGNLPGQDLMQRVFASKSSSIARYACLLAGLMYLLVGFLPLGLGFAADVLGFGGGSVLPMLAQQMLSWPVAIIFLLAVVSAVLSTVDSAILSPASVLSQNILSYLPQKRFNSLQLSHLSVAAVACASLAMAYVGESAYGMLELAYEIGLVGLLVPLAVGLYSKRGNEHAAMWSMLIPMGVWLVHLVAGWETIFAPVLEAALPVPAGLGCAILAWGIYESFAALTKSPTAA